MSVVLEERSTEMKVPIWVIFALAWLTILVLGLAGIYGDDTDLDNTMFGIWCGGLVGLGFGLLSRGGAS